MSAFLIIMLMCTVNSGRLEEETLLRDAAYKTACGPIACFIAIQALGIEEPSLEEMIVRCGWKPNATSTLGQMQDALSSVDGIRLRAVRLSPEQLTEILSSGESVAILPVRRRNSQQVNHAVCAVRANGAAIMLVDYPLLDRWVDLDTLADAWDGQALLVSRSSSMTPFQMAVWGTVPGLMLGFLAMYGCSKVRCLCWSQAYHS